MRGRHGGNQAIIPKNLGNPDGISRHLPSRTSGECRSAGSLSHRQAAPEPQESQSWSSSWAATSLPNTACCRGTMRSANLAIRLCDFLRIYTGYQ